MNNKIKSSDIERWVSRHFEYKKRRQGTQIIICNPFDGDSGWHFNISLQPVKSKKSDKVGYWVHDWRPDKRQWDGSFVKFVSRYKNVSYFEALKEVTGSKFTAQSVLQDLRSQNNKIDEEDQEIEQVIAMPEGSKPIGGGDSKMHKMAINYLNKRTITMDVAKANYIHYNGPSIVFPYIEYGEVVYWQSRSILSKEFLFPEADKSDFIYGFDNVEPNEVIFITESIFDALTVGDNCVATGGADIVGKQFRKIKATNPKTVVLVPDNDSAGISSLRLNKNRIEGHLGNIKMAYCLPPRSDNPELKDWNSWDQEMGRGWSRKYIEKNSKLLSLKDLIRPYVGSVQTSNTVDKI